MERSRWMAASSSAPPLTSISGNGSAAGGGGGGGGGNFIEHTVTNKDTLAGVAIMYGVEVADIRKMNGLVTDRQMFALKSLRIPLPGRHPPSPILSNVSAHQGESSVEQNQPRRASFDVLESLESLRFESPQKRVSPAMSSLQGYYRLKPPQRTDEGMEIGIYSKGKSHYLEDGPFCESSSHSEPPPARHRKSRSLVKLSENSDLTEDLLVTDVGGSEIDKQNHFVRRRPKLEADTSIPLKEENGLISAFSATIGKGLALRPKSTNRLATAADADPGWLNPTSTGLGDSLMANFFDGVRKSSSTSNLQDQESFSSMKWTSSIWKLKPDLQAFSVTRPIFDGLPKPTSNQKSKAALD